MVSLVNFQTKDTLENFLQGKHKSRPYNVVPGGDLTNKPKANKGGCKKWTYELRKDGSFWVIGKQK